MCWSDVVRSLQLAKNGEVKEIKEIKESLVIIK